MYVVSGYVKRLPLIGPCDPKTQFERWLVFARGDVARVQRRAALLHRGFRAPCRNIAQRRFAMRKRHSE